MRSLLVCLFFIAALSLAQAKPVRPDRVPSEPAPPTPAANVLGMWEGKMLSGFVVRVQFEPGGTLRYFSNKAMERSSPGKWILTGNTIVFDINNFSEHRGVILGDVMKGESSNKKGTKGEFLLRRVEMPKP